jgi:hypothetical protein
LELFNTAKGQNVPTSRNEWIQRGQRFQIVTGRLLDDVREFKYYMLLYTQLPSFVFHFVIVEGFYMDSRSPSMFKLTPKVWLIINGGKRQGST